MSSHLAPGPGAVPATDGDPGEAAPGPARAGPRRAARFQRYEAVAGFDRYEDAKRVVDRLASLGFPVRCLTIVGRDARIAERRPLAAACRALSLGSVAGGVGGALLGLAFARVLDPDGVSLAAVVVYWLAVGVAVGVVLGLVALAVGVRRRLVAGPVVRASRYEVLAPDGTIEEALRRLDRFVAHVPTRRGTQGGPPSPRP